MSAPKKIIISRTDSIGDVVLTLPVAGVLKKHFPASEILFLGRSYTKPVINASAFVDAFLNWEEISAMGLAEQKQFLSSLNADCLVHVFPNQSIAKLAKATRIPQRIATTNRLYHWFYCNKLVPLSRRKSDLHEAQLNLRLTEPLIGKKEFALADISNYYGLMNIAPCAKPHLDLLDATRFNLILHPKSKGSAREWSLENFSALIKLLPRDKFKVFVSGTKEEGALIQNFLEQHKAYVTDITGRMNLTEFISFINAADGLLAASTGPLHIAAALGKNALGLYPSMRPIFPQRWAPLGVNAHYLSKNIVCNDCKINAQCHCMNEITPQQVVGVISGWRKH